MHEKMEHLFAQTTQRQEDIRQCFYLTRYLRATFSVPLIITFFDRNFYYFL